MTKSLCNINFVLELDRPDPYLIDFPGAEDGYPDRRFRPVNAILDCAVGIQPCILPAIRLNFTRP